MSQMSDVVAGSQRRLPFASSYLGDVHTAPTTHKHNRLYRAEHWTPSVRTQSIAAQHQRVEDFGSAMEPVVVAHSSDHFVKLIQPGRPGLKDCPLYIFCERCLALITGAPEYSGAKDLVCKETLYRLAGAPYGSRSACSIAAWIWRS